MVANVRPTPSWPSRSRWSRSRRCSTGRTTSCTEGEFLTEILDRTGALLLLDVANVYANARNRGTDPDALLDALPLDRVAYVHVAGGGSTATASTTTRTPTRPARPCSTWWTDAWRPAPPPALMLERDGRYPPAAELHAELDAIAHRRHPPPGHRGMTVESQHLSTASPAPVHASPASRCAAEAPGHDLRDLTANLANRQAELRRNPGRGRPQAVAFDPGRLAVARRALLRSGRARRPRSEPLLAASLGPAWPEAFVASVAGRAPAGALRDGWDLARELHRRGELGDAASVELAEREVTLHRDGRRAPRDAPLSCS